MTGYRTYLKGRDYRGSGGIVLPDHKSGRAITIGEKVYFNDSKEVATVSDICEGTGILYYMVQRQNGDFIRVMTDQITPFDNP